MDKQTLQDIVLRIERTPFDIGLCIDFLKLKKENLSGNEGHLWGKVLESHVNIAFAHIPELSLFPRDHPLFVESQGDSNYSAWNGGYRLRSDYYLIEIEDTPGHALFDLDVLAEFEESLIFGEVKYLNMSGSKGIRRKRSPFKKYADRLRVLNTFFERPIIYFVCVNYEYGVNIRSEGDPNNPLPTFEEEGHVLVHLPVDQLVRAEFNEQVKRRRAS
ncbi:hypothetical protein CL618_02340 [archaeon]|nr:hypothetical protein [archaeon]|tara:strand:- start:2230 stop:2880 length:651 start_codon:yes stop_codon:yes gene_type:complete